ncbi:DUF2752 domain-containing protein [Skermania sp. ID1734]|uniref:DUF2752 domain-containing protein n=1 Tax=Skermania sp. ID1734 TaxID=2597516 RepID=UPI00117EFD6B|nr:DUF2752 domain-containing protein [Skermania sp. ID1734]TSD95584.1 DUF2752 domain-containing protein [Skermania sp. ID1734]
MTAADSTTAAPKLRALAAPVAVAGAAAASVALLHWRDPHVSGAYGFCPFHRLTGLWCPACGGLRAVNDLTDGHVIAALSSNIFVLPLILVVAAAWVRWTVLRWKGAAVRVPELPKPALGVLVAVLLLFTVARNTPWAHWLAPA